MPQLVSLIPTLSAVTGLVGAGSSLFNTYQNQQYQDKLRSLSENPNKLMNYAKGFTLPLSAGVEKGVANEAQAYAAERGLATSPALEQQIVSQAIAPYEEQNKQAGLQYALQALGLGGGAQPNPTGGFTGLASSLSQLSKLFTPSSSNTSGGTTDPVTPTLPYQIPYEPIDSTPIDLNSFAFAPGG